MFKIELCKEKGGIAVKPQEPLRLDLKKIRREFTTLIETPIVLVIHQEGDIVVHEYGELLFKKLRDEEKIREIAKKIYQLKK